MVNLITENRTHTIQSQPIENTLNYSIINLNQRIFISTQSLHRQMYQLKLPHTYWSHRWWIGSSWYTENDSLKGGVSSVIYANINKSISCWRRIICWTNDDQIASGMVNWHEGVWSDDERHRSQIRIICI